MVKILPLEAKTPKIEFGRAYTNSVSITESHNPEILMISPAYESAKKALPLAAELKVDNQKQPLTKIAVLYLRRKISGCPGTDLSAIR